MTDQGDASVPVPSQVLSAGVMPTKGQQFLAERFALAYRNSFMHVAGIGWFTWTGQYWKHDTYDVATRQALLTTLKAAWAAAIGDREATSSLQQCMSNSAQVGALKIAETLPDFAVDSSELDSDPYLLNVANGVLDLSTGTLLPHDPSHRMTSITRGSFGIGTNAEVWDRFMRDVIPSEPVRDYLQQVIGIALFGRITEHILPILTGSGGNGKGKFYEAVKYALGTYSHQAESELFMKTRSSGANSAAPAIVELRGKRFIVCSETEEDAPLASALMKNLTGGDAITARALYSMPITFEPSHTAVLVTNHLPKVPANDDALWRRIRVIPFTVDFLSPTSPVPPVNEVELVDSLRLCADAIIDWALAGYLRYSEHGMITPDEVLMATKKYHDDSDDLAQFLAEMVVPAPGSLIKRDDLWSAWSEWCRRNQAAPGVRRSFYEEVRKTHAESRTAKLGFVFTGIQLVTAIDEDSIFTDDASSPTSGP